MRARPLVGFGPLPVHFADPHLENDSYADSNSPEVYRYHLPLLLWQHLRHGFTRGGEVTLDLCNECHPFFTGKQKLVDTGGRVERFQKRYGERKGK